MARPPQWDPVSALATIAVVSFRGAVFRYHRRRYAADDPGGAARTVGRYHDHLPVLYTSLDGHTAVFEILRGHSRGGGSTPIANLADHVLTEMQADLAGIADLRDPTALGLKVADLYSDSDPTYSLTRGLGAAARTLRLGGLIVPSATNAGANIVVVFPTTGKLTVVRTIVPNF